MSKKVSKERYFPTQQTQTYFIEKLLLQVDRNATDSMKIYFLRKYFLNIIQKCNLYSYD